MKILGIETSCDDTSASVVEKTADGLVVHTHIIASQAKLHEKYGGVVPEVAARKHVETIIPVITESLKNHTLDNIDAIAVTRGPGLITSLHVGVETAKALSFAWHKPLWGINHIEGHIYSVLLPLPSSQRRGLGGGVGFSDIDNASNKAISKKSKTQNPTLTLPLAGEGTFSFPAIALIVSGGHTELILMRNHGDYALIGRTRDDAAGETFDKAAKMLGLPYPGGPEIAKRAQSGNPHAYTLPRPMLDQAGYEFSFSGLKNAIRLLIEKNGVQNLPSSPRRGLGGGVGFSGTDNASNKAISKKSKTRTLPLHPSLEGRDLIINDICASIQHAIADVLTQKTIRAMTEYKPQTMILAGGVSANSYLRDMLANAIGNDMPLLMPHKAYTQDNAAMIAVAALYKNTKTENVTSAKFSADAHWELI